MVKLYILNSPVLTNWGTYMYEQITVDEARELVSRNNFVSAIGHEATAKFLSKLLGVEIPVHRVRIKMHLGDVALVFQLQRRLPEGYVATEEDLKTIPYTLGLLTKIH